MTAALRSGPVRVLVPASSANVGPGFDSAGVALAVYDELIAMVSEDEGVLVEIVGEGADDLPRDESHLVVRAMKAAFSAMGAEPPGFVLRCRNAIPHGRGLGSSAAAIIGGMVLARAMVASDSPSDSVMTDPELLALATTMESHPDNLSAALHGGFTVAWLGEDGQPGCVRMDPHPRIRAVLAVPKESLPTVKAREALPESVSYVDAVHNVGRSALLVHAMTVDPSLLWEAMSDRLHQRARASVYPRSVELVDSLRQQGVAAAISGAGPSVMVLTDQVEDVDSLRSLVGGEWLVHDLGISAVGAHEQPIELPA